MSMHFISQHELVFLVTSLKRLQSDYGIDMSDDTNMDLDKCIEILDQSDSWNEMQEKEEE